MKDIGHGDGKYYSLNVPLNAGIDDETYYHLFKTVSHRQLAENKI